MWVDRFKHRDTMFQRFGATGVPKGSRFLILIAMSGLWQACLVKCRPQVFMLGFPENRVQGYPYLRITVTNECERRINVTITSHVFNDLDTFVLQPAASDTTTVAGELMVKGSKKTKQGVKIITTGEAKVYIEVDTEGALVIPVRFLGYRHYVVTGVSTEGTTQSEILLVGVTDQTDVAVTIHTSTNAMYDRDIFYNGGVIYIQLDEFDTVQIQSDSGDLTGTLIESSSPISVFSGNQAVSINTNVCYLLEQMPAIRFWQTEFVTVPPKGFNYECKIVAAFSWTLVRYQCSLVGWHDVLLMSAGTDVTLQLGSALCTVIASRPILLTMIISARTFDAAMVVMQPIREVQTNIAFYVPETLDFAQIILVTYTDDIYDMTLDNDTLTNVMAPSFEPLYVGVVEDIKSGTHIIKTSGSSLRISGYIFGLFGGKTSGFPLLFQQNRSCEVDTTTTTTTTATTTATTTTYVNGAVDNPTTTMLNNVALGTTTAADNSILVESSRSDTEKINTIVNGTPKPPTRTTLSSFEGTSEPTTETTAASPVVASEQTSETTAATLIVASEPTSETTAVTVIATSEPTTETTTAIRVATSEATTAKTSATFEGSTETEFETIGIAVGTPETTTVNVDTTTVAVVYGTLIVLSSDPTTDPTLMSLEGTTTSAAEVTTITGSLSQAPIRPVICGTYPWTNLTCYTYCANRTRETSVRIVDMRANLIDRKSTSRYLRSLTSALDDRTSAQTIGYTGVIVLVSVFLFIIILDVKAGSKSKKKNLRNPV